MNLKTSLFNKAIIKADIKQSWWAMVIIAILYMIYCFPLLRGMASGFEYVLECDEFIDGFTDRGIFAMILAVGMAGHLFAYLHKSNSVGFMHGLPISRLSQYVSHFVTGYIIIMLPVVIYTAIMAVVSPKYMGQYCLAYLMATALQALIVYSIVAFVSTVAGNIIAVYIFSVGVMLLPMYLYGSINYLMSRFWEGVCQVDYMGGIMPYIYSDFIELTSIKGLLYLLYSVIFFIMGYIFYKNRNLENNNEVVAFPFLRPVFMYIVAFCFSSATFIVTFDSDAFSVIISFIVGLIAVTATFMLNNKSLSIKGIFKYYAIFIVGYALVVMIFAFDILGFQARIPNVNSIDSIELMPSVYNYYAENLKSDKKEEIEMINKLHKDIVNHKVENADYFGNIKFKYNLKNGTSIAREYDISWDIALKNKEFFESDLYLKFRNPVLQDNVVFIQGGIEKDDADAVIIDNKQKIEGLLDAIKEDIYNIAFEKRESEVLYDLYNADEEENDIKQCSIWFEYYVNTRNGSGKGRDVDYFSINENYKNTIKFIEENYNGLLED